VDEVDRLLKRAKARARGLMPASTYRRIYETAEACGGGTFVEIGTYCGAATLALALGARASGKDFRIFTADLLRPGIGAEGATVDEKMAGLRKTFAEFGVEDRIGFHHGTSRELVAAADPGRVDLLLLDGGGRLEMDLALLWDRLAPGCPIVIDDIDGRTFVRRGGGGTVVDQKHRISKLLADRFVDSGLLIPDGSILGTGWYRKSEAEANAERIELLALPAYRELVQVSVGAREFGALRAFLRRGARYAPWLAAAWRRIRPARREG
jgi:predicted O-methyltransferase YrrM